MDLNDLTLVSIDDHLIEPPDVFDNHMPEHLRDKAPKLELRDGVEHWPIAKPEHGVPSWRDAAPIQPRTTTGQPT